MTTCAMVVTVTYCAEFWRLYDDLTRQVETGEIDEYGLAYRLREHRLTCKDCPQVEITPRKKRKKEAVE